MNASKTLATGAAIVAASLAGAGTVLALDNSATTTTTSPTASATAATGTATRIANVPSTAKQIYDGAKDAVAYIQAATPQGVATGTGFAVTRDGLIVTNAHVVDGASEIRVKLGTGGQTQAAQLVGVAAGKDLAVLRIDTAGRKLTTLKLADSGTVGVGDATFAIGNPYGLDHTFTTGIVSALGRQIQAPDGTPDHRRDPDRCIDQPRQFRRPAAERRRRGHRRQLADRQRRRAGRRGWQRRHRLRDPVEHRRAGRRAGWVREP